MAEETTAPAATAGGDTAAAATTTAAVPDKTLLGGGDTAGDTAAAVAAGGTDDWRAAYGEDKELQKILARISTPADLGKKLLNQEKTIRSRPTIPELPQDATPEEIAAYRKQVGVPDAPDGYALKFSDGVQATEADTAALSDYAGFMHEHHVPPAYVRIAQQYWEKRMGEGRVAAAEAAEQATLENMAQIRAEFPPRELARNDKLADEFLTRHFGNPEFGGSPEMLAALNEVLGLRLPTGVEVHRYAPFRKGLYALARSYADDEALLGGDVGSGGKSIDDEYKALIKKSVTPGQKMTDTEFTRMQELAGARNRREQGSRRVA